MITIEDIKAKIDEKNYPYFDDAYLTGLVIDINAGSLDQNSTIRELCLIKAGIEEIKLGDVTIPSPRNHFLILANRYRSNYTGMVERSDGRE